MTIIDDLTALLHKERALLRAGRIDGLATVATSKAALLDQLLALPPAGAAGHGALESLTVEARLNERLIGAAIKGVQSAGLRLRAVREAADGLTAYTADGRAIRHRTGSGTVERRA